MTALITHGPSAFVFLALVGGMGWLMATGRFDKLVEAILRGGAWRWRAAAQRFSTQRS